MDKHYQIYNFSLTLPEGEGRDNIPNLLRHLATTIKAMKDPIEIQDIVFCADERDENSKSVPTFTVYYHLVEK